VVIWHKRCCVGTTLLTFFSLKLVITPG